MPLAVVKAVLLWTVTPPTASVIRAKPCGIHQYGVVHPCIGEILQGRHCEFRASEAIGRIDLVGSLSWNSHPRVAWK